MKGTEELVKEWLINKELIPNRYTKQELRQGKKTPDFKVFKDDKLQFFCEVKALKHSDTSINDTTPSKLSRAIHDSHKQFKDVNADHCLPNVLAFVNMKFTAGVDYLVDVLTGHWFMENGNVYRMYDRESHGRIENEKSEIDLYLWFEEGKQIKFVFTNTDKANFEHLCGLFGIEASKVNGINVDV